MCGWLIYVFQKLKAIEELKEMQASGKVLQKNQVTAWFASLRILITVISDKSSFIRSVWPLSWLGFCMCVLGGFSWRRCRRRSFCCGSCRSCRSHLKERFSRPHPQCATLRSFWTFTCTATQTLMQFSSLKYCFSWKDRFCLMNMYFWSVKKKITQGQA